MKLVLDMSESPCIPLMGGQDMGGLNSLGTGGNLSLLSLFACRCNTGFYTILREKLEIDRSHPRNYQKVNRRFLLCFLQ